MVIDTWFSSFWSSLKEEKRKKPGVYRAKDWASVEVPGWICAGWPVLLTQEEHVRMSREKPWLLKRKFAGYTSQSYGLWDAKRRPIQKFEGSDHLAEEYFPVLAMEYIFRSAIPGIKKVDISKSASPVVIGEDGGPIVRFYSSESEPDGIHINFRISESEEGLFQKIPQALLDHLLARTDEIERYLSQNHPDCVPDKARSEFLRNNWVKYKAES